MGEKLLKKSGVSEWHKRTKETSMSKSQTKTMLITLFYVKCIVHFQFLPQSQRVNRAYYVDIFKWLREAVRRKMPEL
jgi:hypothetical protein